MGFSKIYGHSSKGTEYCRGFIDKHGQWNNGFYCPRWGAADREYCCGPDDHKYCCPKPEVQEKLHNNHSHHVSLMAGLTVGSLLLLMATIFFSCYFCRCCWGYKRRKGIQAVAGSVPSSRVLRTTRQNSDYQVHYSVCPHGVLLSEYMLPAPSYPTDDPPPYPGEPAIPLNEKSTLQQFEVTSEGADTDSPHQVAAWQRGVVVNGSAESEKSSSSQTEASPLPIKVSDTYPLLRAATERGLGGPTERRHSGDMDKRNSVCSETSSHQDHVPGTSWGFETWPRTKASSRRDDNDTNSSFVASTESTES